MKYLTPLVLLLASCTNPEFVAMKDSKGNIVHTATPQTFFNTPDKPSEWGFWYFVVCAFLLWLVWKEFKSVKWPKKKSSDSGASESSDSV